MSYGGHLYITPTGFQTLKDRLNKLNRQRINLGRELHDAHENGDPRENGSYEVAHLQQTFIDTYIQRIHEVLRQAKLIKKPAKREKIRLGHSVKLKGEGRIINYTIVGSLEADPSAGLISDASPVGSQLLGKRMGEQIEIGNGKTQTYTILGIK